MKNNIKVLREQRNLTQQECANVFNVKLRAWQTYEQGISEPKFEVLCKIADYFNVSLDYLLGREPAPPPADAMEVLGIEKSVDDDEFMKLYNELPDYAKQIFVDTMARLSKAAKNEKPKQSTPQNLPQFVQTPTAQQPNLPKSVEISVKPDIQISPTKNSEFAIARGGNGMYKPVPTDEQLSTMEEVTPDMLGE